ncbi:ParB/RepB/Spo0J family partition protein [Erythrobacteraceae bacterium CFH 75059]|uniref:ParB/RepB/Spo0J family partition protein n=1 Tax=Qipengyuania thermophila TaxID=2509361 RepID=UPI0010213941|nr:ParB/RepB/Spo0J family partition protein [Qipengyuania thermophila]TCD06699.1 ParB/RepB/Spo0J family partition protein [Erythrobacteraceae bacterium CFH 75059]
MSGTQPAAEFALPHREPIDRRRKLGRGIKTLLGDLDHEEPVSRKGEEAAAGLPVADGGLAQIPLDAISPLPGQPRTVFDDEALEQLAASIAARGVIQPVIVQPVGDGAYRLVAGERRWRAARIAGLGSIPAIVRTLEPREVMALALIENLQREDLNPLEEARAYQRLSEEEGMTQAEIAALVDKSRSHVANLQRLLTLPEAVQQMIADGRLSMGHARPLVGRQDAETLARRIVDGGLSVRDAEHAARRLDGAATNKKAKGRRQLDVSAGAQDSDLAAIEAHLQEFLGMPIRIRADGDPRSGTVSVQYRTLDQLDLICQRLTGGDI